MRPLHIEQYYQGRNATGRVFSALTGAAKVRRIKSTASGRRATLLLKARTPLHVVSEHSDTQR